MFHISKQNVAIRMQVKHLPKGNSLEIIWSSFLLIIMSKLLWNPVLVRKSLFHFISSLFHSGTGFLLFLSFLHRKLAYQMFFCQVEGKNGKKLLVETFLSYKKRISPMYVFIILQLSRSVRICRKWSSTENKEQNNIVTRNASISDILTFLTLLTF